MLRNKLRNVLNNSASHSAAFAVGKLLNSKKLMNQIIWKFFLVISASISCFYIVSLLSDFFEFKVVSLIESKYEQPVLFPAVTFCSYQYKYFDDKNLTDFIKHASFGYEYINSSEDGNNFEIFDSNSFISSNQNGNSSSIKCLKCDSCSNI